MTLIKLFSALPFVFLIAVAGWTQNPVVKIDPASISVDAGETFTVNVAINDADNLRGISVKVEFDPLILEANKISSGGFLSGFGQTFSFSDKNNTEGWAQYDESILGSGDMAQGDGIICKIDFEALANGVSALTIVTADLRDRDNMPVEAEIQHGTVMVGGSAVVVQMYAALEGPFDATNGVMRTQLSERNLVPSTSPYSSAPETVSSVPDNVVDWVLVQLRQTPSGSTIAEKSCFLKNDGTIVQADGQANLTFWDVEEGSYYLVLAHRNHLSQMSANAVALSSIATEFDFSASTSNIYGGQAKLLNASPPVYGLYAGDGEKNGQINQMDVNGVLENRDTVAYSAFDYNLSGIVTVGDVDYADNNGGTSTNVPAN
ncbi:hypothetical protein EH223_00060 [candidate division KSB1 bacterium]|nr:hypothetical protein [candidate division KSB1 bacterium]RQW07391.1 MAG: hypothetical protein EH223_00060 [candidate division KSB1 bacterium]